MTTSLRRRTSGAVRLIAFAPPPTWGRWMVETQFQRVKYSGEVAFCIPADMKDGKRFIVEWIE